MKNKGFTLVEVLTVVSILAALILIAVPLTIDVINEAKKQTNKYNNQALIDGTQMYVQNIENGKFSYIYNGKNPIEIEGTRYMPGSKISGYDFKVFAITSDEGVNISIKDLIESETFNEECDYNDKKFVKACKYSESCTLNVVLEYELKENGRYYVTTGYKITPNNCE